MELKNRTLGIVPEATPAALAAQSAAAAPSMPASPSYSAGEAGAGADSSEAYVADEDREQ